MPFTFSHPAIVLPLILLSKKWYSLTGLVIGSLTPDFEYFIRMKIQSNYSHTISGLFWFDLPLGIFLAFVFHNIVRDSLFKNLPTILKSRIVFFQHFNWNSYFAKNWLVVVVSILIGAFSHLFWDSFTHENGYFVREIPALTKTVELMGIKIAVLKILQHSSTLFGGIIIVFALFKLPIEEQVPGKFNFKYWTLIITLTFIIIGIRIILGLDIKQYGDLIVTGISAVLLSLIFTPLLIDKKE